MLAPRLASVFASIFASISASVALVAACGGAPHTPAPPPPPAPSCDAVSEAWDPHIRDRSAADKELYAQSDDTIRAIAVQSCREDHWPDALIQCYADGHDDTAWKQCEAMLTPAQHDGFTSRLFAVMWTQ
jgi:hypothetical protein